MENSGIVKLILTLGGIAGALTAIIALIVKAVKVVKKMIKYFKDLREAVDLLLAHDKEQYLSILRLTVMEEKMPFSERVIAAKKYIAAGGNGDVKLYYEEHLRPFDQTPDEQKKGDNQ